MGGAYQQHSLTRIQEIQEKKKKKVEKKEQKRLARQNHLAEIQQQREERWAKSQDAWEQGPDTYAKQIIGSFIAVPFIHFWYSLLYIVYSLCAKGLGYVFSGRIIVENWRRILVKAGYISEAALGGASLWALANHVSVIHNLLAGNPVTSSFIDPLNAAMMGAFTLIPDLILTSVIILIYSRIGECKNYRGKEKGVAILWIGIYALFAFTFLGLTIMTLSSVGSVASSGDISKVVFAKGPELVIRIVSSYFYGIIQAIYDYTHQKQENRQRKLAEEQAQQLADLSKQLTNLQQDLQSEQDRAIQEAQQSQEAYTQLLTRHENEVEQWKQRCMDAQQTLQQKQTMLQQSSNEATRLLSQQHQRELDTLKQQYQEEKTTLLVQLSGLKAKLEALEQQPVRQPESARSTTQPLEKQEFQAAYILQNIYRRGQTTYDHPEVGMFLTVAHASLTWGMEGNDREAVNRKLRGFLMRHPEYTVLSYEGNSTHPYWYVLPAAKDAVQKEFGIKPTRKKVVNE